MAVVIIVLTVLTLTGALQPAKWSGIVIIILAGLLGITSITGACCNCLGKGKEDSGSCCQPPSQGD
jgi:hypothetical protein